MLGFIAGLVAGFLTPHAEVPLGRPVAAMLDRFLGVEPGEVRLVTFILMLLAAGVVAALFHSSTAFWVVFAAALGYFATRLIAALRELIEARKS